MRPIVLLSIASAAMLVPGCFSNHSIGDDAGIPDIDATSRDPDTGVVDLHDANLPPLRDGEVRSDDVGILPLRDAGVRPLGDGGPPGDRAGDEWNGYIESLVFRSGSDHVRIVFDAAGAAGAAGARTGVVVFSDGVPPAPATDPNVGYPEAGSSSGRIEEGLEYRFDDGVVDPDRIRLSIDTGQLYETWCALQYPVLFDEGGDEYRCLPNGSTGRNESGCFYQPYERGEYIAVDCDRQALCASGVCQCTATECVASPRESIRFDFHVTGAEGTGSVDLGELHNIHLTR